jgi:hypothetical protein
MGTGPPPAWTVIAGAGVDARVLATTVVEVVGADGAQCR